MNMDNQYDVQFECNPGDKETPTTYEIHMYTEDSEMYEHVRGAVWDAILRHSRTQQAVAGINGKHTQKEKKTFEEELKAEPLRPAIHLAIEEVDVREVLHPTFHSFLEAEEFISNVLKTARMEGEITVHDIAVLLGKMIPYQWDNYGWTFEDLRNTDDIKSMLRPQPDSKPVVEVIFPNYHRL